MYDFLQRIKIVDGVLVLGFLLVILGIGMNFRDHFLDKEEIKIESKNDLQVDSKVMIDVAGEVINPGVYEMNNGSRIEDVLVMAGGLSANADRGWVEKNLNKATKVVDGQKIYIPKMGEVLGDKNNRIIHLNSATAEDLDKLDGVGIAMAQRIIDYRTKMGGFKTVDEIKLVSGIGEKMFEKIKNEIEL
jgi:competence protein ComEA